MCKIGVFMCGINGYFNIKGIKRSEIEAMNDALCHRGPDDEGVFMTENRCIGLGHRRLAIIDLDGGKQPMSNSDKTIWITFNGEIYNYKELRKELSSSHDFNTSSDTETIIRLYEAMGQKCLKFLRGMFAFAIYDSNENKLLLARDHLGQKPLYYTSDGASFAFASEIKALLAIKPELREMDCKSLYEYLTIRVITPPRSMFKRIKKLPPGHFLTFQDGKVCVEKYWDLKFEPKLQGTFTDIVNELENQIQTSIKYHLVSDVPVGVFLSGGMDSSLVTAMMRKETNAEIQSFAGDVPYRNHSEIAYARIVADRYKTLNHELNIEHSLIKTLPDLIRHLDEPSDPLSVCLYSLAGMTRTHVKVVLGGDGGDELFGGYDRYYGNILASYYALIPESLRRSILGRVMDAIPDGFWYRSASHQLKWMHQMSFYEGGKRYSESLSYFYFSDAYKKRLYTDQFRREVGMFDPEGSIKAFFDCTNASELVDKMLYADSMTRMPDHPVMILDRMTMAHGLEARSPFLDHRLAEFCAAIPPAFKIKGSQKRYIQKVLAKKYLPPALLKKKKQGFSSALPYILKDEFRLLFKLFLRDSHLVRDGYLNQGPIETLLNDHLGGEHDHGNRLWLLCNAEVWYRMYIGNNSAEEIGRLLAVHAANS